MNNEKAEEVVSRLFSGKYSREEILDALAYCEHDNDFYFSLIKKYHPKYYKEGFGFPVLIQTMLKDLKIS